MKHAVPLLRCWRGAAALVGGVMGATGSGGRLGTSR